MLAAWGMQANTTRGIPAWARTLLRPILRHIMGKFVTIAQNPPREDSFTCKADMRSWDTTTEIFKFTCGGKKKLNLAIIISWSLGFDTLTCAKLPLTNDEARGSEMIQIDLRSDEISSCQFSQSPHQASEKKVVCLDLLERLDPHNPTPCFTAISSLPEVIQALLGSN